MVTDSSGAAIPAATLTATNMLTSASKTTTTNVSGEYNFPVLDPGDYKVLVQVTGFQSQTQENIRLDSNQNVHVSFELQLGSTEQNVTVEAQTALVDTRESQIGNTVDQRRIEDLPLNGRNAYDLVQTVPGVTNYIPDVPTGSRAGTQLTVNGIFRSTAFYLDGAYNTDIQLGGNLLPNPDALHELRVLTSNFDAEFGRLPGGVVSAVTRSGASQYHGLAYDYLRNNVFNAKNWFLTSVTPLRQNQFGGDFGGPIPMTRGRGFFFLSYQGLRIRQPANVASSSLITPTALERTGDFRNTPAASRPNVSCPRMGIQYIICPEYLDPVAQNALKFVPVGDPSPGANYGHPVEQAASANINVDQGLARADYHLGEKHQLSGMFFESRGTANTPTSGGNQVVSFAGMKTYEGQYNIVASDIWTLSPTKVNSVRAYYSLNHNIGDNIFGNHFLPDLGSQAATGSSYTTQPRFAIAGYWQMGTTGVGPNNTASFALGISDTFNWVLGSHELKFGGTYIWMHGSSTNAQSTNGQFTFSGSATGNALVDFLLGMGSLTQNNGGYLRTHCQDPSLFVQDNWRLSRRFTANLGLRWEYYPVQAGQNNTGTFVAGMQSTRFPTAPLGLLTSGDKGIPDGILHTPWNTFAPRVGFTYDLFGNGLASLRGAYGIFYFPAENQLPLVTLVQQPFARTVTVSRTPNLITPFAPNPDPFPYVLSPLNTVFLSGANIFSLPPGVRNLPSVQQFSLGVQQQYGSKWSSEINYVGNVARHLYISFDENSPLYSPNCTSATCSTTNGQNNRRPYQPTPRLYTFASITLSAPVANSSYHSLQATLTRRFDRHFSIQTSFVWSKVIGYGALTNSYDLNSSRGPLDIHVPYNFAASYIFVVPGIHHLGSFGEHLLSGWQLNGVTILRSGQPFNVTSGADTNFDGTVNDRPNVVGPPHLQAGRGRIATTKAFFNTNAFVAPPAGTPYGNASFNMLNGPKYVDTDLSASKTFLLYREIALQFRGEVFNVFNNVNLNAPNSNRSSPAFGTISAAGAPRIFQLALRLSF